MVQEKSEVATEKRGKKSARKKPESQRTRSKITAGKVIAGVILLCIVLALYLPVVVSLNISQPNSLALTYIPANMGYDSSSQNLQSYAQSSIGVSGYSANAYISFKSSNVEIGQNVDMQIIIKNTGNSFHNAYFYAFIVNNSGDIVSSFPEQTSIGSYGKFPQWYSGKPEILLGVSLSNR